MVLKFKGVRVKKINLNQLKELILKISSIIDSKELNKKELIADELKNITFDSIKDLVDDQLTEDNWKYSDMNEKEIFFPSTRFDYSLINLFLPENNNFNSERFSSVVYTLLGYPANFNDLEYNEDRIWGIKFDMDDSQKFGFIISRVDEDDLEENLENEDHEVKEYLFLKSNNDDFLNLFELVFKFAFLKILFQIDSAK